MTRMIGFIAEDLSDVEVIKLLIARITSKKYASAHFVGKGCGPIKKKIPGWAKAFAHKGVKSLLIVHDLDKAVESDLRESLEKIADETPFSSRAVIIPKEELEAWLLCDEDAIYRALKLEKKLKAINKPEEIPSPKEFLRDLVQVHSKGRQKQYINTIHNKLIASQLNAEKLKKCPSFDHLRVFIDSVF